MTNKFEFFVFLSDYFNLRYVTKFHFIKLWFYLAGIFQRTRKFCGLTLEVRLPLLSLLHQLLMLCMCKDFFSFWKKNQTNIAFSWTNLNWKRGEQFCSDLQQWSHYLKYEFIPIATLLYWLKKNVWKWF